MMIVDEFITACSLSVVNQYTEIYLFQNTLNALSDSIPINYLINTKKR